MAQRENAELELKVSEATATEADAATARAEFPEVLIIVAKRKNFIFKFVGIAVVASIGITLLLKNTYTANAKIMPPQQNQSMAMTSMLGQLGPLAALAGQGFGLRTPSDIYVGMLRSRTVADAIVDRFSLIQVYDAKKRMDARKALANNTTIVAGKDGIISISVDDHDPNRAAQIANAYAEELEKLTKDLAITEASKRRAFFERETKQAMDDLAGAEQALKETQEKTGLILLDPQSRAMIDSLSSLRAAIAAKEVQVRAMRSFAAEENPDLKRAEQELAALQDQEAKLALGKGKRSIADVPIENVPAAGLEYIRKLREVKYREALFELLAKQYEAAKIDEARDSFVVQELDKAVTPEKKSWPSRGLIVILTLLVSLMLAILAAYLMERLEEAGKDPQFSSGFQLFRYYLRPVREK